MTNKLKRLGLVAIAVLGGQLALAAPAYAGVTGCINAYPANGCAVGNGTWTADGDRMDVCDWKADGLSVVVLAKINGVTQAAKWRTSGAGDCTPRSYGNVNEGLELKFQACLGDYSDNVIYIDTCGPIVTTRT